MNSHHLPIPAIHAAFKADAGRSEASSGKSARVVAQELGTMP